MNTFVVVPDTVWYEILEALKDTRTELEVPEVAELTSLALDDKIDSAIEQMESILEDRT